VVVPTLTTREEKQAILPLKPATESTNAQEAELFTNSETGMGVPQGV